MIYRQAYFEGVIHTDLIDSCDMKDEAAVSASNVDISRMGEMNNKIGYEKQDTAKLAGEIMLVHQLEGTVFVITDGKIYKL